MEIQEEKKNPKLADNPKMFYEEWDKAALDNIDMKKVKEGLATNYPEELKDGLEIDKYTYSAERIPDEVYWLSWRVAFYSYPDMTLLGWETAQRPYAKPESMSYDRTHPDGNKRRVYIYDDNGSRIDVMDVTMKLIYGDK
ncbi:MAG: hypothetical protein IJJ74_07670 [Eubacterium sp.]|nr:hypothetical protein [Eubacterium sp.]